MWVIIGRWWVWCSIFFNFFNFVFLLIFKRLWTNIHCIFGGEPVLAMLVELEEVCILGLKFVCCVNFYVFESYKNLTWQMGMKLFIQPCVHLAMFAWSSNLNLIQCCVLRMHKCLLCMKDFHVVTKRFPYKVEVIIVLISIGCIDLVVVIIYLLCILVLQNMSCQNNLYYNWCICLL